VDLAFWSCASRGMGKSLIVQVQKYRLRSGSAIIIL
jgi:hypothetical protein